MVAREVITILVGNEARKQGKGGGILGFGLGMVAARIATRSLPGAIFVGGAMIAKALYDRSKAQEEIPAADQIIEGVAKPAAENPAGGSPAEEDTE